MASKSKSSTKELPKSAYEREIENMLMTNARDLYGQNGLVTGLGKDIINKFQNSGGMDTLDQLYKANSEWVGRDQDKINQLTQEQHDLSKGNISEDFLKNYDGYMQNQVENAQGKMLSNMAKRGMTQNSTFTNVGMNDVQRNVADQSSKNYESAWGMQNKGINDTYNMVQGKQQWSANAMENMFSPITAGNNLLNSSMGNLNDVDKSVQSQMQTTTKQKTGAGGVIGGVVGGLCFPRDTLITMDNETTKKIQDIKIGDLVKGIDIEGNLETKEVIFIKEPSLTKSQPVELYTDRGSLITTIDQEVYRNGEEIKLSDIRIGDYITMLSPSSYKSRAKVLDIIKLNSNDITYHFDVNGFNFFFANGFAVAGLN